MSSGTMTMPPLPKSLFRFAGYGYTIHDMHAYGKACAAAERERLAKLAESRTDGWHSLTADEIRAQGETP